MRSILVDARPGEAGQIRIDTALALARLSRGHVTLLVDTPVTRFVSVDGLGGSVVASDALQAALAEDDAFAHQISAHLAREDVCCDVVRAETDALEALSAEARLADLVVVAREDPLAGDLALAIRCPVLAVNDRKPLSFPLSKVAIAWDGGSEAAAAVRFAVPLLAGVGEVTVLTVQDSSDAFPATEAVEYLSRHDIHAELKAVRRGGSIEETLANELRLSGAELLVMGTYSHSRLREFLFGGVTRHFLECADGPALLLAH